MLNTSIVTGFFDESVTGLPFREGWDGEWGWCYGVAHLFGGHLVVEVSDGVD